jgi:eukaryotic-like serine/threonine-protein kinase
MSPENGVGSTLGHYRIVRKLGSGGMGEVYLAHDTTLGREVALKVLPQQVTADPDRRSRFEREARAVAALNHPNIVTVHSFERAGDTHFITMECVVGQTLSTCIPPDGLLIDHFLALALPLVDAISAAHEQGVIHCDLKPGNVIVGENGRVKVLDFGLAKLQADVDPTGVTATSVHALTATGQVLGTVSYMSPQQAEGKPIDARSDIFSLGIMFHEMLTGRRPFSGDSHASIVSSILRDSPPLVSDLKPALPAGLARIVKRCLAKDPARRYQAALDVRNELEDLKHELSAAHAERESSRTAATFRVAPIGAVLALLGIAAIGIYWLKPKDDPAANSEPAANVTFSQLTHEAGRELFPSLSPDGRSLVYASSITGNLDVYSQRVGGQTVLNLTQDSPADDGQPAFSPDGEQIAFRSERDGGGIFVMGATGESVRRVSDFGYHPAWSPDGQQLVSVTQSVGDPALRFTTSQLWVITTATGERRLLSEGDAAQPSWSPDGRRIAYWGRSVTSGSGDIWTIPATGGPAVAVTTERSIDWNPVWAPDGRHLYFSSDRGGSMNLWRVAIDEQSGKALGPAEPVTTGVGASTQHVTISRDGRRLAYAASIETTNLQQVAFDPDSGKVVGAPRWVTRGSRSVAQPESSADGQFLAFHSSGSREDVFVAAANGSGLRQLTSDAFMDRSARWSPDGRRIAFYSDRTGKYEIWVINRDGSGLQQLTRSPGAHYPVWSPDGRWMVYSTHSPNGAAIFSTEIPWAEQTPRMLPELPDKTQSFEVWSWSPDGRMLAGQKHLADLSHAGIAVHEIGSSTLDWLTDFGEWPVWMRDGRRILFSYQGKLFLVDRASRNSREILELPQRNLGSVGLSADNRTIYLTSMAAEADIWMMTMTR